VLVDRGRGRLDEEDLAVAHRLFQPHRELAVRQPADDARTAPSGTLSRRAIAAARSGLAVPAKIAYDAAMVRPRRLSSGMDLAFWFRTTAGPVRHHAGEGIMIATNAEQPRQLEKPGASGAGAPVTEQGTDPAGKGPPAGAQPAESGQPGGGRGRVDVTGIMPEGIRVDPYLTEGHPGYEESGDSEYIPTERLLPGESTPERNSG